MSSVAFVADETCIVPVDVVAALKVKDLLQWRL